MTQKSLSDDFIDVMAAIRAATPQDNSDPYRSTKRKAAEAASSAIANGIRTAWAVLGVLDAHDWERRRVEGATDPPNASPG